MSRPTRALVLPAVTCTVCRKRGTTHRRFGRYWLCRACFYVAKGPRVDTTVTRVVEP